MQILLIMDLKLKNYQLQINMGHLLLFRSLENLTEESFSSVISQKSIIINIKTRNVESISLVEYAIKSNIKKQNAVQSNFVYHLINSLHEEYNSIILGLVGMDKRNIYELIARLKDIKEDDKNIILVYSSFNIIKDGVVNIEMINSRKKFDKILAMHESVNG